MFHFKGVLGFWGFLTHPTEASSLVGLCGNAFQVLARFGVFSQPPEASSLVGLCGSAVSICLARGWGIRFRVSFLAALALCPLVAPV